MLRYEDFTVMWNPAVMWHISNTGSDHAMPPCLVALVAFFDTLLHCNRDCYVLTGLRGCVQDQGTGRCGVLDLSLDHPVATSSVICRPFLACTTPS